MDLSKASSSLPYNLLIAKLNAYAFANRVYNYLAFRKRIAKLSDVHCLLQEILSRVPRASILRLLMQFAVSYGGL